MIFTSCQSCGEHLVCYYEAGQPPVGALEKIQCESCGAQNYVERVSVGGRTYSETEAMALPGFRKM